MSAPSERRAAARFEVNADVDVANGAEHQPVRNISLGGICIHSEVVEDVGSIIDLKITFPGEGGAHIELRGTVVWVNRDPPAEMGIHFLDFDEQRRDLLREYLRRAAGR